MYCGRLTKLQQFSTCCYLGKLHDISSMYTLVMIDHIPRGMSTGSPRVHLSNPTNMTLCTGAYMPNYPTCTRNKRLASVERLGYPGSEGVLRVQKLKLKRIISKRVLIIMLMRHRLWVTLEKKTEALYRPANTVLLPKH